MMTFFGAAISLLMLVSASEWSCYEDSCYYVGSDTMTWVSANSFCVGMGSELASIHSAAEDEYLTTLCGDKNCWIGLNDVDSEGNWVWTDGSDVNYLNWLTDQPDDNSGEDYVGKLSNWNGWTSDDGGWNDWGSSHYLTALCKKGLPTGTPTRTPTYLPTYTPTLFPTRTPTSYPTPEYLFYRPYFFPLFLTLAVLLMLCTCGVMIYACFTHVHEKHYRKESKLMSSIDEGL